MSWLTDRLAITMHWTVGQMEDIIIKNAIFCSLDKKPKWWRLMVQMTAAAFVVSRRRTYVYR